MGLSQKRKKQIQNNIFEIKKELPPHITLIIVSKHVSIDEIIAAYECGGRDFGENRVDELLRKSIAAKNLGLEHIRWHFIGNIQSKKIKDLAKCDNLKMIHSIDRIKNLEELKKVENLITSPLKYFVQINTSGEDEKSGMTDDREIEEAILFQSNKLEFHGLMTMSKIRTEEFEKSAASCFKNLKERKKSWESRLNKDVFLSMGMSADYKIAFDYEADYIRLGSLIFATE